MKTFRVAMCLALLALLPACQGVKAALGIWTVKVKNLATVDGQPANAVRVSANGERKFDLDYGQEKSFDVSKGAFSSAKGVTVTASSSKFRSDVSFTLILTGDGGGVAHLLITTQKVGDYEGQRMTLASRVQNNGLNPLQ